MRKLNVLPMVVLLLVLGSYVTAEVPQIINYQGWLTDNQGDPITGALPITFSIYNDSIDGEVLWSETHPSVSINYGLFSVMMGSVIPINTSEIFTGAPRYLGIQVGSDNEIVPRTPITSVGYAFAANNMTYSADTAFVKAATYCTSSDNSDRRC